MPLTHFLHRRVNDPAFQALPPPLTLRNGVRIAGAFCDSEADRRGVSPVIILQPRWHETAAHEASRRPDSGRQAVLNRNRERVGNARSPRCDVRSTRATRPCSRRVGTMPASRSKNLATQESKARVANRDWRRGSFTSQSAASPASTSGVPPLPKIATAPDRLARSACGMDSPLKANPVRPPRRP